MDKTDVTVGAGFLLLGVGLPAMGVTGMMVGLPLVIIGTTLCVFGCRGIFTATPTIENWPVNNALNLRIINTFSRPGLADSQLTLHSVRLWIPARRQFSCIVAPFEKSLPFTLYGDQVGLPFKEPRMFQLIEFIQKSAPQVRGALSDGTTQELLLPVHGIWQFNMELRWAGGSIQIIRWFRWDEQSLPTYCKPPT